MKKEFNLTLGSFVLISFGMHLFFIFLSPGEIHNKPRGRTIEISLINFEEKKQKEISPAQDEAKPQSDVVSEPQESAYENNANPAAAPNEQNQSEGSVSFVTQRDDFFLNYLQLIQKKIEAQKKYPKKAIEGGQEGTSYVKFTVLPNGDVSEIAIINSSGSLTLDEAAIAMVRNANPFPALPQNSPLFINLPITFKINP